MELVNIAAMVEYNVNEYENLIRLYEEYGFELERRYEKEQVLVFGMTGGYFRNVDIICVTQTSKPEKAKKEYEEAGFSVTVRVYREYDQIESDLFSGFFQLKNNKERFKKEYERFSNSVVSMFGESAEYKYLSSPYFLNEQLQETDIVSGIESRIDEDKPILFLIEAAAGFGKTCTAYEIAKLINEKSNHIPFLAELSRNRQARIFKHVLLDEIDRVFPSLSSRLVEREIKNGRVITVLDGFDELLRDGDTDADFEGKEPMLETIGQYLRGQAKLILTTRKTVLFEGDSFFDWIEENSSNFELVRLRLGEPKIRDWLNPERYQNVKSVVGQELENISNPVLLSYLRCISDESFNKLCEESSNLVESYFNFMLEREKTRQDLSLTVDEQHKVLDLIAFDMMELDYTSEERDYIVDLISEGCEQLIANSIERYPPESKPRKEEVAHKLASHALLDRSIRKPDYIGFINDFVFGNYIARNIIERDSWIDDKWSFIEPAITSYKHRNKQQKDKLFSALERMNSYLSVSQRILIGLSLINQINFEIENEQVEDINFDRVIIGNESITKTNFIGCVFKNCEINVSKIIDTTFLMCEFYSCSVVGEAISPQIYLINCIIEKDFEEDIKRKIADLISVSKSNDGTDVLAFAERVVLERFWPVGRDTITYKHRPIKGICKNYGQLTPRELFNAIESLKAKRILLEPQSPSFVEINFNKLTEIKSILGRD